MDTRTVKCLKTVFYDFLQNELHEGNVMLVKVT